MVLLRFMTRLSICRSPETTRVYCTPAHVCKNHHTASTLHSTVSHSEHQVYEYCQSENRHLHAHTILSGQSDAHPSLPNRCAAQSQLVRYQTFHLPNTQRVRFTAQVPAATTAAAKKEVIRRLQRCASEKDRWFRCAFAFAW